MSDDKTKAPRTPNIAAEDENDPADIFARVPTDQPGNEGEEKPPKPPRNKPPKQGGKRAPVIDMVPAKKADADDDPMDPLDAAEEIMNMMDRLFATVIMLRGHDKMVIDAEGTTLVSLVMPKDADKARMKKAIVRLVKSTGATMSPGVGMAFAAVTCYVGPLIALEVARASTKKKPANA